VWSNWSRLEPQDVNQAATLKGLKFDVVTSIEPFYTQFVTKWCLLHNINYSNLIQKPNHKEELDYDIFVDDNPNLAKDIKDNQILLLYRQEWNKNTPESKNVILVDSLDASTRYVYMELERRSK